MNNLHILELSAYTQPTITESKRDNWVEYGDDNLYFDWLIDRYRNSATNNAIINNMARLTYGRGLYAKDASKRPNDYASMKALFSKQTLRAVTLDLKLFGGSAFQVIYNKQRNKIVKVEHIPFNLLRPEKCNKEGKIEAYYYSDNWEDVKKFVPERIVCYTGEPKADIELVVIGQYSVGRKYFPAVDYEGCLDYCLLEERIAEYLINEVENGFSGTKVVNFNNGVPTEEQQEIISRKVLGKLTGSRGQKVIVAFNHDETKKTTVDDIPLNDAPEHYQYLSEEARNKILVGHNITSPMLVGISPDGQGFSSNADEIETASKYFYNTVIKPFQELLIDAIDEILAFNGIALDLYFRRLQLFEDIEAEQQRQEETNLSKQNKLEEVLAQFGEDEDLENWILIDEREVNYDEEDELDAQVNEWNEKLKSEPSLLSKIWNFVSTGTARPNTKSAQDQEIDGFYFKTRYEYSGNANPERGFCKAMMNAKKIYRKEDIVAMSSRIVNAGFGEFGADTYSIWLYKGGARCKHVWKRKTYVSASRTIDVNNPNVPEVRTNVARKYGYEIINDKKVNTKPNDMPLKGFSPNNPNLPSDVR